MGYEVQQSTTNSKADLLFLLILTSDHISPATGKTPTVTIRKVGGSFGSPAGAVTEIANGWYKVAAHATDNATLGPLLLHVTEASSDPTDDVFRVVPWDPYSAVDANVKTWLGDVPASLTTNGYVQAMLLRWLTDDAYGVPDDLIDGKVPVTMTTGFTRAVSAAIQFVMEDGSGIPVTGLADGDFTAKQVSLDGVGFATLDGVITEIGNGLYTITLTVLEWDAALVTFYFAAPGTLPRMFTVHTT